MKKILTILVIAIVLASCNTQNKQSKETEGEAPLVTLAGLASSAENYNGKTITVSGMVTHVCKEGGQKMFLTDSSRELSLKVVVTKSIPEFAIALEGSMVEVTGQLMVTVIENNSEDHHGGEEMNEGTIRAENDASDTSADSINTNEACTANISYQLEATSFKEISD
jgi:hypothetical protein